MYPFTSSLNRYAVLKTMVRHVRNRARKQNQTDPGISFRKSLFPENEAAQEEFNFEELEADFNSLDMTHREHERETRTFREREQLLIVKQKYFMEKNPNFLTWADKQQIRYLHNKDPEEWTVEKLSEGFPALPEVISKIVKSNWTKSSDKVKNHDQSVLQNWTDFKSGNLKLPEHLAEHLNKFTSRTTQNYTPLPEDEEKPQVCLPQGEFSEIITSYERLKNKESCKVAEDHNLNKNKPRRETYTTEPYSAMKVRKMMTFPEYKKQLEETVASGSDISDVDKLIVRDQNEQPTSIVCSDEIKLDMVKYVSPTGQLTTFKGKKDYSYLEYPEKIIIPKDKKRRGFTYKLNDCYYDYDGEFLYRVPGME